MSVVYFVKHKFMKPIKIGYSNNFTVRLQDLNCFSPYGYEVVGTILTDNPQYLERIIHERLKTRRLNGEWFDISHEEAIDIIKESDNSYDDTVQRILLDLENLEGENGTLIDLKLKDEVTNFLKESPSDGDIKYGGMLYKNEVLDFIQDYKGITKESAYKHWNKIKSHFIERKKGKKVYVGLLK